MRRRPERERRQYHYAPHAMIRRMMQTVERSPNTICISQRCAGKTISYGQNRLLRPKTCIITPRRVLTSSCTESSFHASITIFAPSIGLEPAWLSNRLAQFSRNRSKTLLTGRPSTLCTTRAVFWLSGTLAIHSEPRETRCNANAPKIQGGLPAALSSVCTYKCP